MKAVLHKDRILVSSDASIPSELSMFNRSFSFPMCGDILRRLIAANPKIELGQGLRDRMLDIKTLQFSLNAIKSRKDSVGDSRLYPYQRVGVEWMLTLRRGILADDQGLGKTVMAAAACARRKFLNVGIICTSSNIPSWASHMCEYFSKGDTWQDRNIGMASISHNASSRTFIVNYDNAHTLRHFDLDALIVDEAHHVRNRRTKAFKIINGLARKVEYLFLLTATPTVNADYDMWTLLNLCDPNRFSSYWSYIFRFFEVTDSGFGMKIGDVKESEKDNLLNTISTYMLHRDESVKELPKMERSKIDYILDDEHRGIYSEMENEWVATLEGRSVSADVKVAQITRLRQLAISPKLLFRDYHGHDKIGALAGIIAATLGNVVIFTHFEEAAILLQEKLLYNGIRCGRLTGSVSKKERDEVISLFGSEFRALVVTYGTGGESLTLTQAQKAIFLDLAWHPAGNRHAMKRIHRIGQDKNVEIIVLKSKDTIEDYIEDIIRGKGKMSVNELIRRMRLKK